MEMEKILDVADVVRPIFFEGVKKMEVSSSYINTYKALVVNFWAQEAPAAPGPLQPSAEDVLAVMVTNLYRRIGIMAFQAMANAQPPRTSLDAEAVTTALYALFQGELRFFATQAVDLALESPNDVAQPSQTAVHRHLRDHNQVIPVRFRATRIVTSGVKALAAVLAFFAGELVAECKSRMRDRGLTSLSGAMVVHIVRTANQLHVLADMNMFPSGYLSSSSSDTESVYSEPRDDSPLTPPSTSPQQQQGIPMLPPMPPLMLPPPYIPLHLQNPPPPYERWSPASTIASRGSLSSSSSSSSSQAAAAAASQAGSSLPYVLLPPSPASTLSSSQGGGLLPPLQFQLQAQAPPPPNFIIVTAGELRDLLASHRQYIVAYLEHNVSRQQFRERFMDGVRCAARGSSIVQKLLTDSGIDVLVAVDGREACDAVVEAFVDRYGL